MVYRVFSMSSGEDENSTEAHVFARAYRGAWRSIHGCEPAGRHEVAALELVMDFGGREPALHTPTQHRPRGALIPPAPRWMSCREGVMTTDLWARVRRLFGKRGPSWELDQILSGWRAEEGPGPAGSAKKRELLHPMKGWVMENPERAPNDVNPQREVRHPVDDRTRAR